MLSGSAAEELGAQQWHAEILEIVPLNLTNLTNAISCYKSNPARHQGWQQLMLAFLFLHWLHSVYLSVILRTMRIHSGLWRVWYLEASVLKKYEKYPSHSRGDVLCQTGIQNYIKIKKKKLSRRYIKLYQVDGSWRTFLTDSFICIGHNWSWSIGFHPAGSRLASKFMYRNRFFMVTRWSISTRPHPWTLRTRTPAIAAKQRHYLQLYGYRSQLQSDMTAQSHVRIQSIKGQAGE